MFYLCYSAAEKFTFHYHTLFTSMKSPFHGSLHIILLYCSGLELNMACNGIKLCHMFV